MRTDLFDESSKYRIVYFIQGDGSYSYHDSSGNKIDSDKKILNEAIGIAHQLNNTEVFIFHQKPKHKFLLFFNKNNFDFYLYKDGRELIKQDFYVDNETKAIKFAFNEEGKYKSKINKSQKRFLLYYGHTISEDSSYENTFTIKELTSTLKSSDNKYEVIVLSTCKNGSLYTVQSLSSYCSFLIASPENLHLSQMTSRALLNLQNQEYYDAKNLAFDFAKTAFDELTQQTKTIITISVYDMSKMNLLKNISNTSISDTSNKSIITFYKAPKFGRDKDKHFHSGIRITGD